MSEDDPELLAFNSSDPTEPTQYDERVSLLEQIRAATAIVTLPSPKEANSSSIEPQQPARQELEVLPVGSFKAAKYVKFIFILAAGRSFAHNISSIIGPFFRDCLGASTTMASAFTNVALAVNYGSGLVGGALADTYCGHFTIISTACIMNILALLWLFAISLFEQPTSLFIGLSVLAFLLCSASGISGPSISSFIGDQFSETQTTQRSSAYSGYYLSAQLGMLPAGIILPILLEDTAAWVAFVTALLVLAVSIPFFFFPSRNFRKTPPERGTYVIVCKVLYSAFKKCQCGCKYSSNCLDRAKADNDPNQVEDIKSALNVLTIFVTLPFFWGIFYQISSIWVFQAADMNCNLWGWTVPYAEVGILNNIADILLIPLFDKIVYPLCSRVGIIVSPLRKMVVGFMFTILAAAVAGVVQLCMEHTDDLISVWWIVPQYVLISAAEILLSVTAYEFAYTESPKSMRGFLTAVWLATIALGNVVTAMLAPIPFERSTTSFILAGLTVVVLAVFGLLTKRYTYKKTVIP